MDEDLKAKFQLLVSCYTSDLRRLEAISEAAYYLNQMPTRDHVLAASFEHPSCDEVMSACVTESRKIAKSLNDLKIVIESL